MAVFLFSSGMSQNGLGLKTAQFENLGELVKNTIFVAQFENLGELVKNTIFVA